MGEFEQPKGIREIRQSPEQVAKNHLDLRLRFAEAVGAKRGIPLSHALSTYTDLHVQTLGVYPGASEDADKRWNEFASGMDAKKNHDQRLSFALNFLRPHEIRPIDHTVDRYWPFRYAYDKKERAIRVHFGSMRFGADQTADEPGLLSDDRLQEQRGKLRAMFTEIKELHPDALEVRGSSWLYTRESYARLFPSSYTREHTVRKGGFQGGGRWGQFRNKLGDVDQGLREKFFNNIENLNSDNLEGAFPIETWNVRAPVADFYKEYGI